MKYLASPIALLLTLLVLSSPAQADTKVRTSSFEFNAAGRLIKETIEPDSANDCLQTSYTYDSFGNKTGSSKSACSGATGYAVASAAVARTASVGFSADGRFTTSSTNALSQSETRVYDTARGTLTSLTGPNTLTTSWTYDGFGRKTRETRADGTYTTWAHKLCTETGANCPSPIAGAVSVWMSIEQVYAANNSTSTPEKRQYYDRLGRVVRVQTQGFDGAAGGGAAPVLVQDTEYNALGQIARKSNVYVSGTTPVWSSFGYDALGRTTQQSSPDSAASGGVAVTTFSYNGLSSTATNAKGQVKTTTKNTQGKVTQITDAFGSTVQYGYDALGNLTSTNAAGSITTISYNQRGQKSGMVDPSMGAWEYRYNAFGELVWQRDSLNQSVAIAYDVLGRMVQRTEPDLVSQWSYDKKFDNSACGKGVGKLCEATADNGYKRVHSYDTLGRLSSTSTVLDSVVSPAVVSESFDANTGRIATKTWPTGYQASYGYTPLGYLKTVTGGGTGGFTQTVSYEVLAMNAQGQVTQYKTGNQITTVKNYDAQTNRLTAQTATKDGQSTGNVLSQTFGYDALGNLTSRVDGTSGIGTQETFSYDSLNRLTLATLLGGTVSPPTTTEVMYDVRGNITYKSDVGRYWYDAARPNRMTNVTLETAPSAQVTLTGTRALSYAFDDSKPGAQTVGAITMGNGNLEYTVSQDTVNSRHTVRYESYTSFAMPSQIVYGNFVTSTSSTADRTLSFVYGPEHQRIKQAVALSGSGTSAYTPGSTWYLNGEDSLGLSYEKEIQAGGITEHKHYVRAGGLTFALFVSRTGTLGSTPATATSYLQQDHLGSITAITDESGAVVERLAYDPWGKRRSSTGPSDVLDAIVGQRTDRGYTEHEHLDEIGVIHMNGRVFDPLIARFMSTDSWIDNPWSLQSYNRYSYVHNNPLKNIDPTGHDTELYTDPNGFMGGYSGAAGGVFDPYFGNSTVGTFNPVTVYGSQDPFDYVGGSRGGGSFYIPPIAVSPIVIPPPPTIYVPSQNVWDTIIPPPTPPQIPIPIEVAPGCYSTGGGLPAFCAPAAIIDFIPANLTVAVITGIGRIIERPIRSGTAIGAIPRALQAEDLGIKGSVIKLEGSIAFQNGVLRITFDKIEGQLVNTSIKDVTANLNALAVNLGAKTISIDATLANPVLQRALRIDGWTISPGNMTPYTDIISRTVQ